jgi:hypothetical protein
MPPASRSPNTCSNCVAMLAHAIRRAAAVRIPIMIARFRCLAGRPAAARPMTTALSPASTKSIMTTWIKAMTASLATISVMTDHCSPDPLASQSGR